METSNVVQSACPKVEVYPDKAERKKIRWHYNKAGIVILLNILIFNVVGIAVLYGICGIKAGSFSHEAISAAKTEILNNPLFYVMFCIGIPICSETIVILVGKKLLGVNFKTLFRLDGFNGTSVVKTATVSLGLQTATVIIATILIAIIGIFGGEIVQPDFTVENSTLLSDLLLYMYVCLLGPILEELLYRGVLLQSLKKYNVRFAIVISALIFGMMHENITQCILGMLIGIPLAIITIKSGSILPAIFTHIIVNTSNVVFALMIMSDKQAYKAMLTDNLFPQNGLPLIGVVLAILWRFGFLAAGIVVGVVSMVQGLKLKKATPAGKNRSWPIFATSVAWVIVFGYYIYVNTIGSFTFK